MHEGKGRQFRRWVGVLGCFGVLGWAALDANAGKKYTTYVSVWSSGGIRFAQGAIGAARNSADTVQNIGCVLTSTDAAAVSGGCNATDASGNFAGCTTTDYDLLEVIKAQWESSYIQFEANSNGTCRTIRTFNDSYEQPKVP